MCKKMVLHTEQSNSLNQVKADYAVVCKDTTMSLHEAGGVVILLLSYDSAVF